jgi:hypothetical protein
VDAIYILTPALLIAIIVASVWLDRWSVPVILVALGAGIVFGSDVLGLWYFGDFDLTNRIANAALVSSSSTEASARGRTAYGAWPCRPGALPPGASS